MFLFIYIYRDRGGRCLSYTPWWGCL